MQRRREARFQSGDAVARNCHPWVSGLLTSIQIWNSTQFIDDILLVGNYRGIFSAMESGEADSP
jgi:hypothetical protein